MRNLYVGALLCLLFVAASFSLSAQTTTFTYSGNIETYVVPAGVTFIKIEAWGASGGNTSWNSTYQGGKGAYMRGDFIVTPGQTLKILVGQQGETKSVGGGGGGSFVATSANQPLLVAGGGGGASSDDHGVSAVLTPNGTSDSRNIVSGGINGGGGAVCSINQNDGGGGGGFYGDGASAGGPGMGVGGGGGKAFVNGGQGGVDGRIDGACMEDAKGGFGGGGGTSCNTVGGGGGGGYSGGGGGEHYSNCSGDAIRNGGGGGGSFNAGTNQQGSVGNGGNGRIVITVLFNGGTIATDQSFCASGTPAFFSSLVPASGSVVASYQWQQSTDNITFTDIASANGLTYQAPLLTQTTYYRRKAVATNASVAYSNTVTVTINPLPAAQAGTNAVICGGQSATIGAAAVLGNTYSWTSTPTGFTSASANPVVSPATGTTYTLTETVVATGCSNTNTVTVTLNPEPTVSAINSQTVCNGSATAAVPFSGSVAGTAYSWSNSNPSIGLAASGSGDLPSFTAVNSGSAPVTATITVTPSYTSGGVTCTGASTTFTITVNPTPIVNAVGNQVVCNGAATAAVGFSGSVNGTAFTWTNSDPSIGLPASGSGNIASFSAVNTGNAPKTATITVTTSYTNGGATCTGEAKSFTITVNPGPSVNAVSNQVVCAGGATTAIGFSGTAAAYNWTNNTPSIGLAASGSGTIPSFTAVNAGTTPAVATLTVTPSAGGCTGAAQTFTLAVNPTPTVNQPLSQVVCHGAATTAVRFGGAVSGTVYSWTNDNPGIGLPASGTGDIASFVASNPGSAPVTATLTVTPVYAGGGVSCTGTSKTFTLTVNPQPVVTSASAGVVCSGVAQNYSILGSVNGTTFTWSRAQVAGISNAAVSGKSGNTITEVLTNTGTAPVDVTYVIVPSANGCAGPAFQYVVTVSPVPTVSVIPGRTHCNGAAGAAINFAGPVSGTTFTWTASADIGFGMAGSGAIPAYTAVNTTDAPRTATVTVTPAANGCPGAPYSFAITVNPTPTVHAINNQTVCNGGTVAGVSFTGTVAGSVYSWTNSDPSIGLAASGAGDLSSFTTVNKNSVPAVATLTVTPSAGGCTGAAQTFTLAVNPTPTVNQPLSQVVCHGAATTAVRFGGAVSGTVYSWTNDNPGIGLPASGTGDIASFVASNPGSAPVTATLTVTPVYAGGGVSCTGTSKTFTLTVNPQPVVSPVADQAVCAGASTAIGFSGTVGGTTYSWVNTEPSIGLAVSGTGAISSFTAINNTTAPVVATIEVTPSANGCTGAPNSFVLTVNPLPSGTIEAASGTWICPGTPLSLTLSGGQSYQWYLDGASVTGATAGTLDATAAGSYTALITSQAGCSRMAANEVTLSLLTKPAVDFAYQGYCQDLPVRFTNQTAAATPVDYIWSFGTAASSEVNPVHSFTAAGTQDVKLVATPLGCSAVADSVTQSVEIESPVEAVRLPAAEVHYNRYSVLAARNLPRASYQWSPSSMITGVTSVANPSVRLTRPQEFLIEMSFPSGCKTTDSLLVTIKDDELDVPNAFSPNGDGIHDTWVIPYLEVYPENVVEVYNRHGQLVYRAKGYPAPWNGTFKGSPLPVGTYYYIIDLKGGRKKMSGSITILR